MRARTERAGAFTLIELMIVTAIVGVVLSAGVTGFSTWTSTQRAKSSARQIQDLLMIARAEAIRSGVNHIVYFNQDTAGDALILEDGSTRAVALLIEDANGNGKPDSGEIEQHVPQAPAGSGVSFGRTRATTLVPSAAGAQMGDPFDGTSVEGSGAEVASAGNFRHPSAGTRVQSWVLFAPDGTPRSVVPNGPGTSTGSVGSGDGAIYVTNGREDYAVVMAPLGGTRLYRWNPADSEWR